MINKETKAKLAYINSQSVIDALESLMEECIAELQTQLSRVPLEDQDIERKLVIARARVDGGRKLTHMVVNYLSKNKLD